MKRQNPDLNRQSCNKVAAPLVAVVLGAASLVSAAAEQKPQAPARESISTKETTIPVEGMSCVACVARVKKEISAIPGVAAVHVNLAERNARISFDPKRVSAKEIVAAIDKLGYKADEPKDSPKENGK